MPVDSRRIIAIGDVHGCASALDAVVEAIAPAADDTIVLLGDLVDQGHDSRQVLDRVLDLGRSCHVVLIRGNHEEMMLAARDSQSALRYWEVCGGIATLNSYHYGARLRHVPDDHWELLESARDYYETGRFIFTHANYLAHLPMNRQPEHQLRWALLDPVDARPHVSGKTVVVGHTEQADCEVLDLGSVVCIDTACWRHGWLTALEMDTGHARQASRFGIVREAREPSYRGLLPSAVVTLKSA